ncbi:MAG TPA: hypothetical protein VD838_10485, partial [Anaeromyxobacteraceae bacterium]|nr:hypothetical protein [Anaeromyxobacteraceae bacterium]
EAEDAWSFGTDEEGLRAALGDEVVDAGAARLADAYRGFLGSDALRDAIADLLAAHPTLSALDPAGAWDLEGLRIASMSLTDGMWADTDADGTLESSRSALTVRMTLPSFPVATPAAPFPGCGTLLGDGSAAAAVAADAGRTWVEPADASWRWRLTLVAHLALADLAPVHDALWDPTDYPSQGERDAAAHDLGLFAGFLADPAAGLPGSDLVVAVEPDPELAAGTLHVVSALARTAADAECLREVDGWLAEVALIQPSLTAAQLSGAAPEGHLLQAHPALLDAADGVEDPGLSCLHDAAGNPLQVASEPACATASGSVEVLQPDAAGPAMLVTPYLRLSASLPEAEALGSFEIAPCTEEPWSSMCTGRFGRGIRLCLGEWAIRSQVGDYWNIHWYQSPGKAAAQTAIKAAGYVLRAVAYVYMGTGETKFLAKLAAAKEGPAYASDVATNLTGKSVAGYSIKFAGKHFYDMLLAAYLKSGVVTKEPNVVASFAVDKVVDGLAQMAEVEAVGWQDYSSDSHCRCHFEYRHPNYCD